MYQTNAYINVIPQHPEYVASAGLQDYYSEKLKDYQQQQQADAQAGNARGGICPPPVQYPCPACGYCSHCGRGGSQPYYPYPSATYSDLTCGTSSWTGQSLGQAGSSGHSNLARSAVGKSWGGL